MNLDSNSWEIIKMANLQPLFNLMHVPGRSIQKNQTYTKYEVSLDMSFEKVHHADSVNLRCERDSSDSRFLEEVAKVSSIQGLSERYKTEQFEMVVLRSDVVIRHLE